MIAFSPSEVALYCAVRLSALRQRGKRWRGPCPVHRGKDDNFGLDPETGLWRCWSNCGPGDIIKLEILLTGAPWRAAVSEIGRIIGRTLLESAGESCRTAGDFSRRALERAELTAAEYFRFAAARICQLILDDVLPEAIPERSAPTQFLLGLRAAEGAALIALFRGFREREPIFAVALVYAGERAWERLCTRLARFVDRSAEVSRAA